MEERRKRVAGSSPVSGRLVRIKSIRHDCKREGLVDPASSIFMPV